MSYDPRDEFLQQLPTGGRMVEVGVKEGDFSQRILDICQPDRLLLVDPWAVNPLPEYEGSIYGPSVEQAELDAMCRRVKTRFAGDDRVIVDRATSERASAMVVAGWADVVYIDGDHIDVYADLLHWWPAVKPGGLLTGDDYATTGRWWGDAVTRDVDRFAAERGLAVRTVVERQFLITKP